MRDVKYANGLMVQTLQLQVDSAHAPVDQAASHQARVKTVGTELKKVTIRTTERVKAGNRKP